MTTTTTIPGELFLLLTNDAGRQEGTQYRKQALIAAAIAELVLRERIELDSGRNPTVRIVDRQPTGEPVLDQALTALSGLKRLRLKSVLSNRSMDLTETIGQEFVAAGAVTRKSGWFATTWPVADPTLGRALRARLGAAVQDTSRASLQDGILLELLRAQRIAYRILRNDIAGMKRGELDRVIKNLQVNHPAAEALRRVMDDMTTVMIASTAAVGGGAAGAS